MIACDTSVLVAAFSRWHDAHDIASAAVRRADALIDHVAVETFSVLTRLPAPRRAPAQLVTAPRLRTPAASDVLARAVTGRIAGGAVYDLLVALTAATADAAVLSLDRRAAATYEAAEIRFELLG